jgi:predicted dehydrogenase
MSRGTGLLWEINGTEGDIRVSAAGGHLQIFDAVVEGAGADDAALQPLPVPETYFSTSLRGGPALNVAEAYARLANDLRDGTSTCPTFEDAVVRHQMIEAIEASAARGARTRPADY